MKSDWEAFQLEMTWLSFWFSKTFQEIQIKYPAFSVCLFQDKVNG